MQWFPWKPAHLVAAVFIEDHQEDGHDHEDADHDDGVEHGVEEAAANRGGVLGEGRVDPAGTGVCVNPGQSFHRSQVKGGPTAAGRSSRSRS